MAIERIKPAFHFEAERIEQLKQIAPEAFADGKINWEVLQEALGNYLEEDNVTAEHFGLFWPGKRAARKIASIPSEGTLVPCPGEGVDEESTKNIFIEGENLEVLKLLQKSYANRIKIIYIDPPYNTGKDFIYEDNFTESIDEYLRRTGQLDEDAKPISANTKSDGRFHSKWLSMMYPRLRLARNLLRDDGIIFISIDDNEIHNLRNLMNETFGEANYIGTMKRRAARKTANLSITMSDLCDYVLVYCKGGLTEPLSVGSVQDTTRPVFNQGNAISNRIIKADTEARCPDGLYKKGKYGVRTLSFDLLSDLIIKNGKSVNEVEIKGPWRINQTVLNQTVYYTRNFGLRRYLLPEEAESAKAINDLIDEPTIYNEMGSEAIDELFGFTGAFENPKPPALLDFLIKASEGKDEADDFIVLDFFAGSGTTGHSILSSADKTIKKKFILVQLDEPISEDRIAFKKGYRFISELTKDRLKRISKKVLKDSNVQTGFKVYKLQKSNFNIWENYTGHSLSELQELFDKHVTPLIENWQPQNLLTEILLIEGFPLDCKLEVLDQYKKNEVTMVISDFCDHKLLVCLDKKVYADTIKSLQLNEDDVFICLDSAITDQDKVTLQDKGLIKTI